MAYLEAYFVAIVDKIRNAQRGQIETVVARLQGFVHLFDIIGEQQPIDIVQGINRGIVVFQHQVETVSVLVVLPFLKRNIDDGFGDFISHFLELFGLFDKDFEFITEVDLVGVLVHFEENFLLQESHGFLDDAIVPFGKLFLLELVNHFGQFLVLLLDQRKVVFIQSVLFGQEFDNGAFNTIENAACPADRTGHWGHVLGDHEFLLAFLEQTSVGLQFLAITV